MGVLSWAAITKSHRLAGLGGLQQQDFVFSQFWRLKVQYQDAGMVSVWWDLSPWAAGRWLLIASYMAFPPCLWVGRLKGSKLYGVSSCKGTNLIMSISRPHLNEITSQRTHFQMPSHWGLAFNIWIEDWGREHTTQWITLFKVTTWWWWSATS